MARLKVFTTASGFYDLAVAAPSQAAALAAWGIRQNLFAHDTAKVATDKAVIAAALSKPGVVLKRPLGTKGPFAEETALPKPKASKIARKKSDAGAAARKAAKQADADLEDARRDHIAAEQALERERAAIEVKLAAEQDAWNARRAALEKAGNRARRVLRKR